jgi:hypothetical protein
MKLNWRLAEEGFGGPDVQSGVSEVPGRPVTTLMLLIYFIPANDRSIESSQKAVIDKCRMKTNWMLAKDNDLGDPKWCLRDIRKTCNYTNLLICSRYTLSSTRGVLL